MHSYCKPPILISEIYLTRHKFLLYRSMKSGRPQHKFIVHRAIEVGQGSTLVI